MKYIEINQSHNLLNEIHNYWELKGDKSSNNWERIFPDGCPGLIMNLGDTCSTDNGTVSKERFLSNRTVLFFISLREQ